MNRSQREAPGINIGDSTVNGTTDVKAEITKKVVDATLTLLKRFGIVVFWLVVMTVSVDGIVAIIVNALRGGDWTVWTSLAFCVAICAKLTALREIVMPRYLWKDNREK